MSYYFIVQISIQDEIEYQKYTDKVTETILKYKGKYLAVDTNPAIIEGQFDYSRCVIITFPTKNDFESWYNSKEYQEILPNRLEAANCTAILIKGLTEIK